VQVEIILMQKEKANGHQWAQRINGVARDTCQHNFLQAREKLKNCIDHEFLFCRKII